MVLQEGEVILINDFEHIKKDVHGWIIYNKYCKIKKTKKQELLILISWRLKILIVQSMFLYLVYIVILKEVVYSIMKSVLVNNLF